MLQTKSQVSIYGTGPLILWFYFIFIFCTFLEGGNIEDVVKERIKFINSQSQHSVTNGITLYGNYIYTLVSQIKEPGSLISVNLVV